MIMSTIRGIPFPSHDYFKLDLGSAQTRDQVAQTAQTKSENE